MTSPPTNQPRFDLDALLKSAVGVLASLFNDSHCFVQAPKNHSNRSWGPCRDSKPSVVGECLM